MLAFVEEGKSGTAPPLDRFGEPAMDAGAGAGHGRKMQHIRRAILGALLDD